MDAQEPTTDSSAPPARFTLTHADRPLPETGRIVGRALWAGAVLVVLALPTIAVMTRLTADTWWWPLSLLVPALVADLVLRRVRAPRPGLKRRGSRGYLHRVLRNADARGQLPDHPVERTAAGVYACQQIEGVVMIAATMATACVALFIWPPFQPWLIMIVVFTGATGACAFRAALGHSYLQLHHQHRRQTTGPSSW